MKIKRRFFLVFLFLLFAIPTVEAEPTQVLINTWAMGIDNASGCPGDIDSGWEHNAYISLSRCYKNPASPDGQSNGGSAFKNGPVNGSGCPGCLAEMWQSFVAPSASETFTVTFSTHAVCVGCDFITADLYGRNEGGTEWEPLARVFNFVPGQAPCGSGFWPKYCGDTAVVPHYDQYLFTLAMQYTTTNALGAKVTGLALIFDGAGESLPQPTATPPAAGTPEPTSTSQPMVTPTSTPVVTPQAGRWCTDHPGWPGC